MKKQLPSIFKRIPKINDKQARTELGRAHLLVALLSFALLLTLVMNLQPDYSPDSTLTGIASALLVFVGLFSLAVSIKLYGSRK